MNRTIMWATALTMVFLFSTACELGIEVSTPIPQTPDDVELSVLIVPPDRGYVEIDGSIITSGIAVPINHGKLVNLVAKPIDTDWQFARWERDMSGTSPGETLVMDESKVVRAVFAVPTPLPAAPVSITPEYREDFEDGLAQGWQSEAGWSVVQDGNNNVFQGRNHSWTTFTQGHAWNDYVLRFRVKLLRGAIHINYKLSETDQFSRYFFALSEQGLHLQKEAGGIYTVFLPTTDRPYVLNRWHNVEIRGDQGNILMLIDDEVVLNLFDQDPLPPGTIAFESLDDSSILIDDVEVLPASGHLTTQAPTPQPTFEATFSVDVSSGVAPLTVRFRDETLGAVTSWRWDFGDDAFSTEQNPTHTYAEEGTYVAWLKVAGSDGSEHKTPIQIIVSQPPVLLVPSPTPTPTPVVQATFSVNVSEGSAPLNVRFTDTSKGNVTAWAWDFGDGTASTQEHPVHEYTEAGNHKASLRITDDNGESDIVSISVTVNPGPLVTIDVQPSWVTVDKGTSQQFTAVGADEFGNNVPGLAFVWGATGGVIDEAGIFTAMTEPGLFEVKALTTLNAGVRGDSAVVGIPPVWIPVGDMAESRDYARAVLLDDGEALVGGRTSMVELFDPTTRSFSLAGHLLCGRFDEAPAVRLDDGKVLIVGGAGGERCADIYDPVAGTFRRTGEMNVGRTGYHSATLLNDGRVLVVGGPNESGLSITEVEIYDPKTGTFSLTGSLIAGRSLHAATLLQDGRALIVGGVAQFRPGVNTLLNSAELYDPTTGEFTLICCMKSVFESCEATLLENGKVVLTGGSSQAELFDPVTESFSPTGGSMAETGRVRSSATRLLDGTVLISGGSPGLASNSVELYDPLSDTFVNMPGMGHARQMHGATLLPDGSVLVIGGSNNLQSGEQHMSAEIFIPAASPFTTTQTDSGTISGHVYADDGVSPISDVRVRVFNDDTRKWVAEGNTAGDGNYAISVPYGAYRVHACPTCSNNIGYVGEWYRETLRGTATRVEVNSPVGIPNTDFTLDVGGTISGYVYGPDGMTPVAGVQIGVWHDGISDWHGPTWTAADGSYVLTVPAGQHKVLASPQVSGQTEFPNMWHGGASVRAKATLVPVTAPNNTPGANFVLGVDDASSNVSDPLVGPTPSGSGVLYVNEEADFLSVAMKLGEMEIIDFEALPDGSTLNSGDTVIGDEFSALGVTFEVTELPGNSLQTCTPPIAGSSNSLSPGACPNIGGDASQDDLVIRFDPPVVAAGFRIIDNGGGAGESVTFLDMSGRVINKVERLPNVWVGSISAEAPIAEIRIVEMANDGDDVNYDDIMFVQGPVALLSENFESAAGGWTFNMSNWIVGRDDGDYFLSGLGHHTATYLPGAGWDDYRLELSVKLIGPATHINVRSSEIGRYFVGFDMNGIGLSKQIRPDTFFPNLARANFPVAPDVWHKIAITVFDNRIMIAVDGVERINYTDQEPILSQGTIGLEPLHDENAHVLYDDITVIEATDTGVMAAPPAPAPAPMPVAPVSSEPRTATISGQVFDVDGVTPMEGVLMRAEGGGIFGWADSRHTGADGSFTLEVPPGQYRVVACTPCTGQLDYYEYWHENTGDPLSATFVSVDNQTPATGLVYTLDSIGDATGWPMIAAATSTYIQDWENGPQGWFGKHGPNDPVVLVDDPTAPSGSMVQQLTRRTGAGDYFSPLIPVTSGQTYCAGAWIKWLSGARPFVGFDGYDHGRRDGRYWLIGREGYGSSLGGNDTVTPVLADIDEWRWHEKQFTIGFGDSLIRLTNELSGETVKPGPDLAYFDDLSVRLGQCDGQPTSVRTRASVDERIVFTSDRDGNKEIYTMNLDGSGVSRNTDHGAADGSPSLSPDGKRIAFVSNRDDDYEIYVMSDDGSGQTRLTDSPSIDGSPSWSPDGSRIAFTSLRDGNWEIYVMNADGSDPLNLTDNPAVDLHPSWSPDGVSIAFSSDRDGSGEIYTMTPDGTDQTRLTNNVSTAGAPSWSPDLTKIAFHMHSKIFTIDTDGANQTQITESGDTDIYPRWTSGGTRIVFTSMRDGHPEVYIIGADGSGVTNITNDPSQNYTVGGP